jgi:hypothetical protein
MVHTMLWAFTFDFPWDDCTIVGVSRSGRKATQDPDPILDSRITIHVKFRQWKDATLEIGGFYRQHSECAMAYPSTFHWQWLTDPPALTYSPPVRRPVIVTSDLTTRSGQLNVRDFLHDLLGVRAPLNPDTDELLGAAPDGVPIITSEGWPPL